MRRLLDLVLLAVAGYFAWSFFEGRLPAAAGPEPAARPVSRPRAARAAAETPAPRLPTELEQRVMGDLEAQVRRDLHGDHVVTTDGRILRGRVVREPDGGVRVVQSYRGAGQMELTLKRSEVREVVKGSREPPQISFRDVRFQLEFPDFRLYRRPPFTIVTDQDFFRVEDAISRLEELHVELTQAFGPLIARPERSDGIQLLFFSKRKQFDDYRKRYASELSYASGFYSRKLDRLVVFDQESSKWARRAIRQVDRERAKHRRTAAQGGHLLGLERWHDSATGSIRAESDRVNRVILRHEGAHQLFFTYGVHSEQGAEHLWLVEGLASFCEDGLGGGGPEALRDPATSFAELVDFAGQAGFDGLPGAPRGDAADFVDAAYAQSRFVVSHLMRSHRQAFFDYIRFVRDPANRRELRRASRFALLARFLGLARGDLERELRRAHARATRDAAGQASIPSSRPSAAASERSSLARAGSPAVDRSCA